MNINGWEIETNFLVGPHKNFADYNFDHAIFITPGEDYACLIYDIAEIALGWEVGKIAIFKDRNRPELVLNPESILSLYSNKCVQFVEDGRYAFISMYKEIDSSDRTVLIPFLVLDLKRKLFSIIETVNSLLYSIDTQDKRYFKLIEKIQDKRFPSEDGRVIEIDGLDWRDFIEIDYVYSRINESK